MILRNLMVFGVIAVLSCFFCAVIDILSGDLRLLSLRTFFNGFLIGGIAFAFLVFLDKDYPG